MASHPIGSGSAFPQPEWHSSGHLHTRNQLMAFLRAGVIALLLLRVLAVIVLVCPLPHRVYVGAARASWRCALRWSSVGSDLECRTSGSMTTPRSIDR